ncbi:RHS repeat domain-containing protein [Pseudomonas lundensis]|uniref:RHS repeat domain-containing protein n=1 Tax=Pseudomonas lundensis TaxID=86185 RepID=UPI003B97D74B
MAQALRHQPMRLLAQPSYTGAYDIDQDPLWTHTPQALPIDVLAWYQCDHLGMPQELTDPTGQIAWSAQYNAWGEVKEQRSEWAQRQGLTNPIRFQGQYHDHETGLHYNRYRYYDPRVGRFVSKDPISYAGGLNLYAYAPNPVEWVDPLGLARKCQLGTYGSLTGKANTGDSLDAHEFIRNDALEQMGLAPEGTRNKSNPSIAIPRSMHTDIHRNENVLAALHLNVGRDQFQFGPNGLPSKRQMDVWQGALRTSGIPASRARELRKRAEGFLATCPCLCN